jgi:hypothetical protein
MKLKILILFSITSLLSCNPNRSNSNQDAQSWGTIAQLNFPETDTVETIIMDKQAFPKITELIGENVFLDADFPVKELQPILKDSFFIIKCFQKSQDDYMIRVYSQPEFKEVAKLAKRGNGPDEFIDIRLISTQEKDKLFYIVDVDKNTLSYVDNKFQIKKISFKKPENISYLKFYYPTQIDSTNFLFASDSDDGRFLYQMNINESIVKGIYNLSFDPTKKFFAAYLGAFSYNPLRKRFVHAYLCYHRLVFSDLDGKNQKIIQFKQQEELTASSNLNLMNDPKTIYYYTNSFSTSNYVYLIFRGKTDSEFKENPTMYIEQWDWDGNPINKFFLTHIAAYELLTYCESGVIFSGGLSGCHTNFLRL